jgi:peptidoglycan/LPS O-acetylase OafA/YrhL
MLIVMHYAAVGGAMLALLWCLPRMGRPEDRPFRILVATVFLGVVANAGLAATLSTVHPRYESRVIWLVVLAGGVAALQLVDERRRRRPLADGVHGSSRPGTL